MRLKTKLGIVATVATIGTVASHRAVARWESNPDPTDGDPMSGPAGTQVEVTTADGARLVATDAGSGPAVLLVHGYTGTEGHYAPVARRLVESGYRVISVDQRGHGRSSIGTEGFTVEAIGSDIATWIAELDLRDVVVSGHSMGGLATMSFAVDHLEIAAERVQGYVLVATAGPDAGDTRLDRLGVVGATRDVAIGLLSRPHLGRLALRRTVGKTASLSHIDAARTTYVNTLPESRRGAAAMLGRARLSDRLPSINRPTSIVVGSRDNLVVPARNHEAARLIPGATIHEIPDAGHMLPWEYPDLVTDLIVQAHKPA